MTSAVVDVASARGQITPSVCLGVHTTTTIAHAQCSTSVYRDLTTFWRWLGARGKAAAGCNREAMHSATLALAGPKMPHMQCSREEFLELSE